MKCIIAAGLCAAMLSISPAQANWEWTRWGTTPEQVLAASKGKAVRLSDQQVKDESSFLNARCRLQMPGPYTVGGITFDKVNFCFDNSGLSSVNLRASEDAFGAVDRALRSALGAPVAAEGGSLPSRMFNDPKKGNTLRLVRFGDTILQYLPMASGF